MIRKGGRYTRRDDGKLELLERTAPAAASRPAGRPIDPPDEAGPPAAEATTPKRPGKKLK